MPQARDVRARDLGIPFEGTPGPLNAITDVDGVRVGLVTIIRGEGPLVKGKGPVRTGVTTVIPRGSGLEPVFAGWFSQNGNGEMTGTAWIDESGCLEGPVLITNTHSVGVVRDAAIEWSLRRDRSPQPWLLPVVAETYDGFLNDTDGFHVTKEHVLEALDGAVAGRVPEGNVGGGTGMNLFGFKGGTGTASRVLSVDGREYCIGVLVQGNYGRREDLLIAGVPVGQEITTKQRIVGNAPVDEAAARELGSIIVVAATDAPLLPHQLRRIAKRVTMGLARTGSMSGNGSGDIFIAFSTANQGAFAAANPGGFASASPDVSSTASPDALAAASGEARAAEPGTAEPDAAESNAAESGAPGPRTVEMLSNEALDPLFKATVLATEEAIVNAMVAAEDMVGINGNTSFAIPHERLREVLRRYNRLR